MRIISGKFKGKKIFQPQDKTTRPLKDLTKESIFNLLEHSNQINVDIENANILDLFSGVGSFGLECLSRGSKFVIFYENYPKTIINLKKNIEILGLENFSKIFKKDVFNENSLKDLNCQFDIIFLDPPYKEKNIEFILNKIIDLNLLKSNGVLIIHRHKNDINTFINKFKIQIEKKYGISKVIFLIKS